MSKVNNKNDTNEKKQQQHQPVSKSRLSNKFLSFHLNHKKAFQQRDLQSNKNCFNNSFNVPKINIICDSDDNQTSLIETLEEDSKNSSVNSENKVIKEVESIEKISEILNKHRKSNLNESNSSDDDILLMEPDPRVARFLSIADMDEDIQSFSEKYSNQYAEITEEDEDERLSIINERKIASARLDPKNAGHDSNIAARSEMVASPTSRRYGASKARDEKPRLKLKAYHDGSGIPQEVKANIIRNILKDYNVDYYVKKFTDSDIAEIKLDQHNPETRPIRERLMKLMKSDVIRINDVNYMRELSRKLQESYVDEQKKLMDYLEEKERQRERKLRIQGLIEDVNETKPVKQKTLKTAKPDSLLFKLPKNYLSKPQFNSGSLHEIQSEQGVKSENYRVQLNDNNELIPERFANLLKYEPITEFGINLLNKYESELIKNQNKMKIMFEKCENYEEIEQNELTIEQVLSENDDLIDKLLNKDF